MSATAERVRKTVSGNYSRPTSSDFNGFARNVTKSPAAARKFLHSIGVTFTKDGKVKVKPI